MRDLRDFSKEELVNEVEKLRNDLFGKNDNKQDNVDKMYEENPWGKIFDTISNVILLIDGKGFIINCNKAARKFLKLPYNKLIRSNLWRYITGDENPPKGIDIVSSKRHTKEIKIGNKWLKITVNPILLNKKDLIENYIVVIADITERINYFTEVEERKNRFEDLVELANIAIISDDKDGKLIYFNKQFADLFGYTVDEIRPLSHNELVHPGDLEMVTKIHNLRFSRSKTTSRYEFRGVRKDKNVVYIDISVSGILEADGKVIGTRSFLRDITEKKHSEWKINEQVKKIKCLQSISTISAQTDISIDNYFDQITELLPDAFQYPENTSCKIEYKSKVYKTNNFQLNDTNFEIDLYLKKKVEGKITICNTKEINANELLFTDEEKELINTVSIKLSDFLERQHSELIQKIQFNIANAVITSDSVEQLIGLIRDQLGLLIDTRNFFVAFYDKNTKMLSCPYMDDEVDTLDSWPAERSITGYMIRQKKPLLLSKKDYLKLSLNGECDIIGAICEVWLGVPLKVKNEIIGAFVVQSYTNPNAYSEDDLEVLEFVSHQISISLERKKAIEDLEKALEKARESDRLKSAFLTNMSHEIRTPMNGILGFTKLLSKEDLEQDKRKKYLEIVDKNSKQLLSIIGDILDISKIETGQLEAYNQKLNLYEFITGVYEFYKPNFEEKNIEFTLKLNFTDKSLQIITDEGKLNQIISNLLSNALKFTKEGSVELGCMLKPGNLAFYVKDTGIGIDKSYHDKIFDRFRQAELEITRQYEGNGLGLSITKGFVELLGGEIWLDSELGRGAAFNFTIQLNIYRSSEITEKLNPTNEVTKNSKYKILVVDDDEESCLYLRELLAKYPEYSTAVLSRGIDAINYVKKQDDIDIVLLDIKMPEMDGYDTAKNIKSIRPGLTLIAQTAYAFYNDKQKAFEAGFNDYISKPILPDNLIKLLRKYLVN